MTMESNATETGLSVADKMSDNLLRGPKAEEQAAAAKLLECVKHTERPGGVVHGHDPSGNPVDHKFPASTVDEILKNGKGTNTLRSTDLDTGNQTYQLKVNGRDYVDYLKSGKEEMFRLAKDYSRIDPVKEGSLEYQAVHKAFDQVKIKFQHLPVCEIKAENGKSSGVTEPLDLVASGRIRETLRVADSADDLATRDAYIKQAAQDAYNVPLHSGISRYNRGSVLQEVRQDTEISQEVMDKFNATFEQLATNGKLKA